jgi:hypothetical protein
VTASQSSNDLLVCTARVAERALTRVSTTVKRVVSRVRLRLRAFEAARDREVASWVEEMRSLVERGEIDRLLAEQPDDPRALIEQRRAASS